MGINGYFLSWLQAYLKDRHQIVSISGTFSEKVAVTSGGYHREIVLVVYYFYCL